MTTSPTYLDNLATLLHEAVSGEAEYWARMSGTTLSGPPFIQRFMKEAQRQSTPLTRVWRRNDGKPYQVRGRQFHDHDAIQTMKSKQQVSNGRRVRPAMGFLHMAIHQENLDAMRWGLRCGLSPNHFCPDMGSVPMGLATYNGFFEAVEMMWQAGGDVIMVLEPHHAPDSSVYHGTTLLHRMLERTNRPHEDEAMQEVRAKIALFLVERYPDPLVLDHAGRSVLDMARGPSKAFDAVGAWIAQWQAKQLQGSVPVAPTARRSPRRL